MYASFKFRCQRSFVESKSQLRRLLNLKILDVKDRLLKANHNNVHAIEGNKNDVKDRLLKANHNSGNLSQQAAQDVKDRLLKANHNC